MYSLGYSVTAYRNIKKHKLEIYPLKYILLNKVIFLEKEHFPIAQSHYSFFTESRAPSGLINGQQAENMLSFFCVPAADI